LAALRAANTDHRTPTSDKTTTNQMPFEPGASFPTALHFFSLDLGSQFAQKSVT